jgi:hypothetical protein
LGGQAGCGDVTSLYKNLVKNRKTNFLRQAIQEPIFSVAHTDFEGGGDGRGRDVRHFFGQIGPTQPYGEERDLVARKWLPVIFNQLSLGHVGFGYK